MNDLRVQDIIYLAGVIDCNGHFNIAMTPRKNGISWHTSIDLGTTNPEWAQFFKDTYGITPWIRHNTKKGIRKSFYSINISGDKLTIICKLILPYLINKKKHCEIMIKMRDTFPNWAAFNTDMTLIRNNILNELIGLGEL